MTAAIAKISRPLYGAIELKQSYQTTLGIALLAAILMHIAFMGALQLLFREFSEGETTQPDSRGVIDSILVFEPGPPITIEGTDSRGGRFREPIEFSVGIPRPVADELVADDPVSMTIDDLRSRYGDPLERMTGGAGTGHGIDGNGLEEIQGVHAYGQPRAFTPYEVAPKLLKTVLPVYPKFALETEMEGTVYMALRIDITGRVITAEVAEPSGSNVGFEEAALAAVVQWRFRPAVNAGHAVEVWYYIPIRFEIER